MGKIPLRWLQGEQTQVSQALHNLTSPLLDSPQHILVSLWEPSTAVMMPLSCCPSLLHPGVQLIK